MGPLRGLAQQTDVRIAEGWRYDRFAEDCRVHVSPESSTKIAVLVLNGTKISLAVFREAVEPLSFSYPYIILLRFSAKRSHPPTVLNRLPRSGFPLVLIQY